ncbi:MAG TPA: hypothetical protein PLQ93_08525 [Bacteroidia bacterium]|nr:hypothetical protein [Bacteroidia bacterium]
MSKKKSLKSAPKKKARAKAPAKKTRVSKSKTSLAKGKKPKQKKKSKGNGEIDLECFLTTACIRHKGLGDNCKELRLLRDYRDGYLRSRPSGRQLVDVYYKLAPDLVQRIEGDAEKSKIYTYIYSVVQNSCSCILNKDFMEARILYSKMVKKLLRRYA